MKKEGSARGAMPTLLYGATLSTGNTCASQGLLDATLAECVQLRGAPTEAPRVKKSYKKKAYTERSITYLFAFGIEGLSNSCRNLYYLKNRRAQPGKFFNIHCISHVSQQFLTKKAPKKFV